MTATAKRKVGHYLQRTHNQGRTLRVGQRRACRLIGMSRSSYRYQSRRDDSSLRVRLKVLADPKSPSLQRPRFGYLYALLSREGRVVNHKRVYRLYREEGLTLAWRGRKRRAAGKRVPLERPTGVNERWSVDFIHDQLGSGSRFRVRWWTISVGSAWPARSTRPYLGSGWSGSWIGWSTCGASLARSCWIMGRSSWVGPWTGGRTGMGSGSLSSSLGDLWRMHSWRVSMVDCATRSKNGPALRAQRSRKGGQDS